MKGEEGEGREGNMYVPAVMHYIPFSSPTPPFLPLQLYVEKKLTNIPLQIYVVDDVAGADVRMPVGG